MANMIPSLTEQQLNDLESQGEAKVYRTLRDNLGSEYHVYYSVGWILRRENDEARDGEADFVICHANKGFVTIEVKGGGVGYEGISGEWYSIDGKNNKNTIKDPVKQSLRAKFSIFNKLVIAANQKNTKRDVKNTVTKENRSIN